MNVEICGILKNITAQPGKKDPTKIIKRVTVGDPVTWDMVQVVMADDFKTDGFTQGDKVKLLADLKPDGWSFKMFGLSLCSI